MRQILQPPQFLLKPASGYIAAAVTGFLWGALISVLSGCAFVRGEVGQEFSEARIQEIQKGTTTRQEVAQQFGAPDEVVQANGLDIWHYRHFDSKFGWLIFLSRLNVGSDNLWVFFNPDGLVENVVYGNHTDQLEFQVWPFGD